MPLSLRAAPTLPKGNEWSAAHLGRYAWACNSRKGPVLDAACGAGQGTRLLSENHAFPVIGMDINPDAIIFASHYHNWGVGAYVLGDVEDADSLNGFEGFQTILVFIQDAASSQRQIIQDTNLLFNGVSLTCQRNIFSESHIQCV